MQRNALCFDCNKRKNSGQFNMQLTAFINQIFSVLVRLHYVFYVFIALILGYLFALNVGYQTIINICKSWGTVLVFSSILICVLNAYFVYLFYGGKYGSFVRVGKGGVVVKDVYFPTKITSDISPLKKVSGYLYVIFRVAYSMLHGFPVGVALFMSEML